MSEDPPLVTQLPRRAGQKEARYAQLLTGEPQVAAEEQQPRTGRSEKLAELEERVEALENQLQELAASFERFRSQFE